jgi:hypothetical protein
MPRHRIFQIASCVLPLVCALALSVSHRRAAFSQNDAAWRADFEQAKSAARQANKPLFVVIR